MKESKFIWGLVAAVLFLAGLCLNLRNGYLNLSESLNKAQLTIQTMKQEHDCAMQAANAAMKAREEENARNQKRIAEAERVLEDNDDFGGLVLPDDIARLFHKDGSAGAECGLPAPGGAFGRH
ncbi:hypothetical protein [Desulfovibrio sp. ZJ369]|uniref:hypothetical protein n=1 Tax=Desulfovibrio sp. ZJ369 TaxID=2709793 RepID=UPI0013EDBB57|nr:hypothetical protein [Desulfovibrio sp. ZJ369]